MVKRRKLLLWGIGLSLLAVILTVANVIFFPFARQCYGYGAPLQILSLLLALAGFLCVGRRLENVSMEQLTHREKKLRPLFILAFFLLHLLLGYLMEYTPSGDNHMLYDGPQTLARLGNFGGDDYDLYLSRYANQWGFFLILTAFYKGLFALGVSNTFFPLVLVQALLYAAAENCLLVIARKLRGVRAELLMMLMLLCCLPFYFAAGVLYTDTFSLPFVVFTLYFALKLPEQRTIGRALACAAMTGLMAFIGCQIKMTVAVMLIAAAILWLLEVKLLRAAVCAALSFTLLIGGTQIVHGYMTSRVLDPAMVAQHNTPTIHWVMMSIPTGNNPYGGPTGDYGITWGMMENGASREEIMDSIYTRMKDRIYTLRYPNRLITAMMRKNAASLGDGTFGMTEMLDDGPVRENALSSVVLEGRPLYGLYQAICTGVFCAQLILAACSLMTDLRRKDITCALPAIAVFGMLLFLLLWEARGRYVFSYVPVVLLLSAACASRPLDLEETVKEGRVCRAIKSLAQRIFAR